MLEERPVSFASKSLTKTESNYSNIERECFTVVFKLEHFKQVCSGREVIIRSYHKPLEVISMKPILMAPPCLQCMLLHSIFNVKVLYIKSKEIKATNCLSCLIRANTDNQIEGIYVVNNDIQFTVAAQKQ